MKLANYSINLGYPIYSASFVNENTLIVGGGGGDGNNGIPNKITAIMVRPDNIKKPLKRYRELLLNDNEDSVMSLDVGNNIIIAGINESSMALSKGVNKHLRKFKFEQEHLKFIESAQIHSKTNFTIYQKITAISKDGSIGVIVMSDDPSSIYVIETLHDLEEKYSIVAEGDVCDIAISNDAKLMCYITSDTFKITSLVTGNKVFQADLKFQLSKVRFLDNNEVIITGKQGKDAIISKFSISSSKIVQKKMIYKNFKGITSMDVNTKNGLIVIATSTYSLILVRISDLKVIKILHKVHDFAITKAVFSEDGKYLASTSAANTVNVVVIPNNFADSKSILSTIFQYIISIILIAILAITTQHLYENGYISLAMDKAKQIYEVYKPQDSSSYFTIEPIESFKSSSSTLTQIPSSTLEIELDSLTSTIEEIKETSHKISRHHISSITPKIAEEVEVPSSFLEFVPSVSSEIPEITSTISDIAGITISNDIISIEEVSSDSEEVSSNSFLTQVSTDTADIIDNIDSTPEIDLSTVVVSSSNNEPSLTVLTPTNEITKEITKEIVKEITSVKISTEIQTSIHYITQIETSVETQTSVQTSTVTSIEKSVITVPVTVNVTSTVSETGKSHNPETVSETHIETTTEPKIVTHVSIPEDNIESTPDVNIQIEPVIETFENSASGSKVEQDHVIEELEQMENETSEVSIQIEPSKAVYDDSNLAMADQNRLVTEELEYAGETTTAEASIQIEPSKAVYDDSSLAMDKQNSLVSEELENEIETTTAEASIQIEPTKHVYTDSENAKNVEEDKVLKEISGKGEVENKDALDDELSNHVIIETLEAEETAEPVMTELDSVDESSIPLSEETEAADHIIEKHVSTTEVLVTQDLEPVSTESVELASTTDDAQPKEVEETNTASDNGIIQESGTPEEAVAETTTFNEETTELHSEATMTASVSTEIEKPLIKDEL